MHHILISASPFFKDTGGLNGMGEMPNLSMAKPQEMDNIYKNEIESLKLLKPQEPMTDFETYVINLYSTDHI